MWVPQIISPNILYTSCISLTPPGPGCEFLALTEPSKGTWLNPRKWRWVVLQATYGSRCLCDSWVAHLFPDSAFVVFTKTKVGGYLHRADRQSLLIYCIEPHKHEINLRILLQPQAELWWCLNCCRCRDVNVKYSGAFIIIQQHQQTAEFRFSAPGLGPYLCWFCRVHNIYDEAIIKQSSGLQLL